MFVFKGSPLTAQFYIYNKIHSYIFQERSLPKTAAYPCHKRGSAWSTEESPTQAWWLCAAREWGHANLKFWVYVWRREPVYCDELKPYNFLIPSPWVSTLTSINPFRFRINSWMIFKLEPNKLLFFLKNIMKFLGSLDIW